MWLSEKTKATISRITGKTPEELSEMTMEQEKEYVKYRTGKELKFREGLRDKYGRRMVTMNKVNKRIDDIIDNTTKEREER